MVPETPVLLRIHGSPDLFLAERHSREQGRIHAYGRWRHREGANNQKFRCYGMPGWRSWPSHLVEIRPLEGQ